MNGPRLSLSDRVAILTAKHRELMGEHAALMERFDALEERTKPVTLEMSGAVAGRPSQMASIERANEALRAAKIIAPGGVPQKVVLGISEEEFKRETEAEYVKRMHDTAAWYAGKGPVRRPLLLDAAADRRRSALKHSVVFVTSFIIAAGLTGVVHLVKGVRS